MEFLVHPYDKSRVAKWSGGTTTELFIYPEEASLSQLNFDFRLSTATVEVDTSDFTPLPEVSRTLMVLEGQMSLDHKGHHSSALGKFDIDRFDGDWHTMSQGTCTDFNLMTRGRSKGDLVGIEIKKDEKLDFPIESSRDWFFLYVHIGSVQIVLNQEMKTLNEGELISIENFNDPSIEIKGAQLSKLVLIWIRNPQQ